MSAGSNQKIRKRSMLALYELERLNLNPIEMLAEVYKKSMEAYDSGRGYTDKGDSGAAYLNNAVNAAKALASYRYPTLSAVAIKDMSELEGKQSRPLTTREALEIMKKDPFASAEIKELDISKLPDVTNETKDTTILPIGSGNDSK